MFTDGVPGRGEADARMRGKSWTADELKKRFLIVYSLLLLSRSVTARVNGGPIARA